MKPNQARVDVILIVTLWELQNITMLLDCIWKIIYLTN